MYTCSFALVLTMSSNFLFGVRICRGHSRGDTAADPVHGMSQYNLLPLRSRNLGVLDAGYHFMGCSRNPCRFLDIQLSVRVALKVSAACMMEAVDAPLLSNYRTYL